MNRELIEKVAGEYSGSVLGFKDNPVVMAKHNAFTAGADWRINSVWHKKHTVIPDAGRPALLELKDPDSHEIVYKMDSYSGYEWRELTHYEIAGLIRFVYIDELLPEGKEETK